MRVLLVAVPLFQYLNDMLWIGLRVLKILRDRENGKKKKEKEKALVKGVYVMHIAVELQQG